MADHPETVLDAGFLGRWSRLKSQPESLERSLAPAEPPVDPAADLALVDEALPSSADLLRDAADPAVMIEEPLALTDADMPDIESLGSGSDFGGFFSEQVSEQLRRKAFNKLFHLPEFNIRDGLNEYDEDYSTFVPLGDTVTYQMKQFIERQKQQFSDALKDDSVDAAPMETVAEPDAESKVEPLCAQQQTHPGQFEPLDEDELGVCE